MNQSLIEPAIQPVGDSGLMVRFGAAVDPDIHAQVLEADSAISAAGIEGVTELIPSFAALFVGYDPLQTDFETVSAAVRALGPMKSKERTSGQIWQVPVCYGDGLSPDLAEVAVRTGLSEEEVINAHLSGDYLLYMYGFAPGYAYLGGVPKEIQLPRKTAPVRDIPAGAVMIAGPQALVTTIKMPTGWWIIGQSPFQFLRPGEDNPFPLAVGDRVQFTRMSRDDFERAVGQGAKT
ncbi:allophanate hydrolase subunit 1 [Pseudohalocynthiibacter aestuariivivens]|uniref:Allophanate hydrolase subunit 1 n=1 Tax=Pseudohalocynthiibacter aestuariivivens TaxID=1591409 RepID=A0ABV5JGZ2_9RHOB|nr:allophanate hydrolase subunit 1 [Pseudohalocynthiibacter sp. F2068]